jgi:hypothetical protein
VLDYVFHAPHAGHLPCHFIVSFPHSGAENNLFCLWHYKHPFRVFCALMSARLLHIITAALYYMRRNNHSSLVLYASVFNSANFARVGNKAAFYKNRRTLHHFHR